jgi:threonyl-tRNA synthetase
LKILPVSDKYLDLAHDVMAKMKSAGIRVEIDDRSEKIGYKIRDAEVKKTPYMAIVGEKELLSGTVSVRQHGKGDQGSKTIDEFKDELIKINKPDSEIN